MAIEKKIAVLDRRFIVPPDSHGRKGQQSRGNSNSISDEEPCKTGVLSRLVLITSQLARNPHSGLETPW
jgi:hypothetical protein